MKQFKKLKINDIPFEGTHAVPNSRKTLVTSDHLESPFLEAVTKGFLESGKIWDWHDHEDIDEVSIVLKGTGKYFCGDEETSYEEGDVFIVPANLMHKIEANGNTTSEFYFMRVKSK